MLQAKNLTYSLPGRVLYKDASFIIEDGRHCALIGANGTGKSTLIDMMLHSDDYIYRGKLLKKGINRIGYVSQFVPHEKDRPVMVAAYLREDFDAMQAQMDALCEQMGENPDDEGTQQAYQDLLDEFMAVDGYDCESNIRARLRTAGLEHIADTPLADISGGEYKLVQMIRQMLRLPDLLILDEPEVFLDFENIGGLRRLINTYPGTLLAATHSRYLLNHCFDMILQLENEMIQPFDGSYIDFCFTRLQLKIELQELSQKETEYIIDQEALVERLRDEATKTDSLRKGKTLHARVSYLERWKARHVHEPYLDDRKPMLCLPEVESAESAPEYAVRAEGYGIKFDDVLLQDVNFTILPGEKVALVGPNGTGKSTLLRNLWEGNDPALSASPDLKIGYLSQFHGQTLPEKKTVRQILEEREVEDPESFLRELCMDEECLDSRVGDLSGGERNLLQLAVLGLSGAELLLMDEPASHLDLRTQMALESAVSAYKGTVLMVSHDFYSIAACADYVLYFDNHTVRKMSARAFRKLIYRSYFTENYLALDQKKKELELNVISALRVNDYDTARALCGEMDEIITRLEAAVRS